MSKIQHVKILADLIEPGEDIIHDGNVATISKVRRFKDRLRVKVELTLDDGRTVTIGGTKFVRRVVEVAVA